VWLIAVSFIAVAFAAVSLWLAQARRLNLKSWLASAVLVAWVVGVGVKLHFDQVRAAAPATSAASVLPSIAWPTGQQAARPVTPAATAAAGAPKEVAPVSSLVAGLEQRLAAQPNDANGWALLAQSYAFMGKPDAAEQAIQKAISLGVDEKTLRARVDGAARNPHPAIGGSAVGGG
jgi:cytochrome c-type biogenesis protein CcmH/NrfG